MYPRVSPPYRAYALSRRGPRRRINAEDIIVELGGGIAVQIHLAPHPNFAGQLILFATPLRNMARAHAKGVSDSFEIRNGGANVVHLSVTRRIGRPIRRRTRR